MDSHSIHPRATSKIHQAPCHKTTECCSTVCIGYGQCLQQPTCKAAPTRCRSTGPEKYSWMRPVRWDQRGMHMGQLSILRLTGLLRFEVLEHLHLFYTRRPSADRPYTQLAYPRTSCRKPPCSPTRLALPTAVLLISCTDGADMHSTQAAPHRPGAPQAGCLPLRPAWGPTARL